MAFKVPSFPLGVDIYSGPFTTRSFRVTTVGNLAPGRRNFPFPSFDDPNSFIENVSFTLLLPAGTDVRDLNCNIANNDIIEVPRLTGSWYAVTLVGDSGKGFSNEFRWALLAKISQAVNASKYPGLFWPIPIP